MLKRSFSIPLLLVSVQSLATSYYVSNAGDDANSGTDVGSPFATIQQAVDSVAAGDVIYLRGGEYHEQVDLSGVAGTSNNPITITNYDDEVVVMDGTEEIDESWTLYDGNIYSTTLSEDITQLFVDHKMMTLARYPNALVFSDLVWRPYAHRRYKT